MTPCLLNVCSPRPGSRPGAARSRLPPSVPGNLTNGCRTSTAGLDRDLAHAANSPSNVTPPNRMDQALRPAPRRPPQMTPLPLFRCRRRRNRPRPCPFPVAAASPRRSLSGSDPCSAAPRCPPSRPPPASRLSGRGVRPPPASASSDSCSASGSGSTRLDNGLDALIIRVRTAQEAGPAMGSGEDGTGATARSQRGAGAGAGDCTAAAR